MSDAVGIRVEDGPPTQFPKRARRVDCKDCSWQSGKSYLVDRAVDTFTQRLSRYWANGLKVKLSPEREQRKMPKETVASKDITLPKEALTPRQKPQAKWAKDAMTHWLAKQSG